MAMEVALRSISSVESIGILCAGRVLAVELLLKMYFDSLDAVVEASAIVPGINMSMTW
jgi:hypothetical protein